MGSTLEDEGDFYSEDNLSKIDETVEIPQGNSSIDGGIASQDPIVEKETTETVEEDTSDCIEDEAPVGKTYTLSIDNIGDIEMEDSEDDSDEVLSPEERMRMFADAIMSCCLGKGEIHQYALDKLLQNSSPQLFRDENYILFSVLYAYRGKIKRLNIDEEFLKLFLNRNRGLLQKSRSFIDINAYGEVDGSVELGYIGGVIKHYKRLLTLEDMSTDEFETCFEKYLIEFKAIETDRAFNQAQIILTDGLTIGKKQYFGFEDSSSYIKRRLAEIEGLANMQKGTGFTTARELLTEEKESVKSVKIADFDKLEVLNENYGGIYTGMFYQVIAPPKAGKTKFCVRVTHTASVKFGTNVSVWAQEGGKEAYLAQLRAVHFDYTYNTGVSITEKKYGVSQDVIMHDKFESDELKALELSSKIDLASNMDYGSIDFIDRPFEVETFLEDIDTSIKSNHSQLLVIDYLQIMGSAKNVSERERVSDAYKRVLGYCKTNNIAVLSPGQYKQEVFDNLMASGNTSDIDMRTAGGTSSEVLRTPDIIFAFWATTQDILNNTMKILSMPCRFNKPFPEVNVVTDFEVCQFVSVKN